MTDRLELNWKLDGFVDEQRYYCSETPIDIENLPTPKTVLADDVRSYIDTAIELGKTYYVAVGSVKNLVEKLSAEYRIQAGDPQKHTVISLFNFNNLTDKTGKIWTKSGDVSIVDDSLSPMLKSAKFDGGYLTIGSGMALNTSNFTIEGFIRPERLNQVFHVILDTRTTSNLNGVLVWVNQLGELRAWCSANGDAVATGVQVGVRQHFCVECVNGVVTVRLNGIANGQTASRTSTISSQRCFVGQTQGGGNFFYGNIDNLRVSNIARYNADFTPPDFNFGY